MRIFKRQGIKTMVVSVVGLAFVVQLTSCGYIMHSERRGQKIRGGVTVQDMDWKVLGLDMLLGIVFGGLGAGGKAAGPSGAIGGVVVGPIALFVDMYTGCLYLPDRAYKAEQSDQDMQEWKWVKYEPEILNQTSIEEILGDYTGTPIHLTSPNFLLLKPNYSVTDPFYEFKNLQTGNLSNLSSSWVKGSDVNYIHDASGRLVNIKFTTLR